MKKMSVEITNTSFHGWEGVRLTNGLIDAVAVPEIGGRLMQFKLGPYQYLFMNPELLGKRFSFEEHAGDGTILSWKNYGGDKTWPAPQGWERDDQWSGPPDPVLDTGHYEADVFQNDDEAGITMVSPPDHRSGLRIHRKLTIEADSSRLALELTFENISNREIQWSIWDVAQLACSLPDGGIDSDCRLYIPTDPALAKPYHVMFGEENTQIHSNIRPGLMAVNYQGIVGKLGVHSRAGWIAFANQKTGYVLCMRFPYHSNATYPDDGSTVECWTESPGAPSPIPIRSPGCLMEAEILSPLYVLRTDDRVHHRISWNPAFCPGPIVDVKRVGCVNQPLKAVKTDQRAHISGVFGCYDVGLAEFVWLDSAKKVVCSVDIGKTSPLETLHIDRVEAVPQGAAHIQLKITPRKGSSAGILAEAVVH